jgi:murein DD-endopeptidase MepM/ murein hydrolase activator NlpD
LGGGSTRPDDVGTPASSQDVARPLNTEILNKYSDKILAEKYILGKYADAKKYIDEGNFDAATKQKLTDELKTMKTEWHENEKTETGRIQNRNVIAVFKGYEIIQTPGSIPVYKNQNGAALPFPEVNSEFNKVRTFDDGSKSGPHKGIDLPYPEGTPTPAIMSGTVVFSGFNSYYGNTVVIDHGNGKFSLYAHNSRLDVKVNDQVTQGQQISASGNTGSASRGAHMHFAIFDGNSGSQADFTFPSYTSFIDPETTIITSGE